MQSGSNTRVHKPRARRTLSRIHSPLRRSARAGMLKRLSDELAKRVAKGSEILIAVQDDDGGGGGDEAVGGVVDEITGQYVEPGLPCARSRC